jgi:hypothetical protein
MPCWSIGKPDKKLYSKYKFHKMTAVDFLVQQIINKHRMAVLINNNNEVKLDIPKDVIEVAKAMEKQEIIDADLNATIRTAKGFNADVSVTRVKELAEQYYKETYNK